MAACARHVANPSLSLGRPRVPRLNLGVFKTPRGSTMTYDSAAVRPVSSRTLSKAVSDKQGGGWHLHTSCSYQHRRRLRLVGGAVTMFSNSLYTAEEAASQSSDTIPSWQGSQAQQDSSQVPALPGGRPMATRAYSMPLARGMDVPSTSSPAQQTPFSAAPSRYGPDSSRCFACIILASVLHRYHLCACACIC